MQLEISKKFRFESAHRLIKGYEGSCGSIHGHTWHAEITISSIECCQKGWKQETTYSLNEYDFLVELSDLNSVREWINQNWDHALLLNSADPLIPLFHQEAIDSDTELRLYQFIDQNPTIEVIARRLWEITKELVILPNSAFIKSIRIDETPFQYVILTGNQDD